MLRITPVSDSTTNEVICLEGVLDAGALCELERGLAGKRLSSITIDLTGLTSMDAGGREFLGGLRRAGCRLLGGSLYIQLLLREVNA